MSPVESSAERESESLHVESFSEESNLSLFGSCSGEIVSPRRCAFNTAAERFLSLRMLLSRKPVNILLIVFDLIFYKIFN